MFQWLFLTPQAQRDVIRRSNTYDISNLRHIYGTMNLILALKSSYPFRMEEDYDYTQLDDEDMEAHLIRRAEKREQEKQAERKLIAKRNSFRWKGGMP